VRRDILPFRVLFPFLVLFLVLFLFIFLVLFLQVVPTAREVANAPALRPKPDADPPGDEEEGPPARGELAAAPAYRIFSIAPVVNGAPFDRELLAGTLLVEKVPSTSCCTLSPKPQTDLHPASYTRHPTPETRNPNPGLLLLEQGGTLVKGRIKGVEAFMTMTARTAEPMQAHGAPLARQTCPMLHYFEAKVVGNVFGMAVGLVAGSVEQVRIVLVRMTSHSVRRIS
jgi:hypothetical protein